MDLLKTLILRGGNCNSLAALDYLQVDGFGQGYAKVMKLG